MVSAINLTRGPKGVADYTAVATVGMLVAVKSRIVDTAAQALHAHPDNADAISRWRTGQLASLALSEAVVLYGFILRLAGGSLNYAALFYVVGLVLLLLVKPTRP